MMYLSKNVVVRVYASHFDNLLPTAITDYEGCFTSQKCCIESYIMTLDVLMDEIFIVTSFALSH